MDKAIVSKKSLRELTGFRRLPSSLTMFLAGGWLLDVLIANNLDKKYKLWHMAYQAHAQELNKTQMTLRWKPIQ
jgi:hypothetical protein